MNDFKETRRLIRLKRYEKPPSGYHDNFLNEFRERQRGELLRRSSMHIFIERLAVFTSDMGKSRWLVGGALAYGLIALLMMADRDDSTEANSEAAASDGMITSFNESPLLNPRIDFMHELSPVLDRGEQLLVPVDFSAVPKTNRVNGVIIGTGSE